MFEANCSRQMGQHKKKIFHQPVINKSDKNVNDTILLTCPSRVCFVNKGSIEGTKS